MSATLRYLEALRRQQLGEDVGDLAELEREARAANTKTVNAKRPKVKAAKSDRLHFKQHAWRRMAQRGVSVADVYAIYRYGERSDVHRGRVRYRMTEKALAALDGALAAKLRHLAGEVIVVSPPDEPGQNPLLVTVLAFGKGTR